MRTITNSYDVYTWDELTEDQKEEAIEELWDINVDHDWWDGIYDDALTIGLKITGFDIGRGQNITGDLIWNIDEVVAAILENHGEQCDTYKVAQDYLVSLTQLKKEQCQEDADMFCHPDNAAWYESYIQYNDNIDTTDIDDEFKRALLTEYLSILSKEYDYLTSREAIIETIECNEYEFTEDGDIV